MVLDSLKYKELLDLDIFWQLHTNANGYENYTGNQLVTQVRAGRCFQVIGNQTFEKRNTYPVRIQVKLLEDGYICWLEISEIFDYISTIESWTATLLEQKQIQSRVVFVLDWIEKAALVKNQYLWGGTIGPDFDCSGLIQAAFSSQGIWLPRDAYQQEHFCQKISVTSAQWDSLISGDLLFFGNHHRCDHVGIYREGGSYWHSSGHTHGRNGIGSDNLQIIDGNTVSAYYRSRLRGAGRVNRCHDGITLP